MTALRALNAAFLPACVVAAIALAVTLDGAAGARIGVVTFLTVAVIDVAGRPREGRA